MSDTAIDHARRLLEGFGNELRETRKQRGVRLRQLQEITGIRHEVLGRIENAQWMPSPEEHQTLTEWLVQQPSPSQNGDPA